MTQISKYKIFKNHLKQNSFVSQDGELYSGNSFAYVLGPYGVKIKEEIINKWKSRFINIENSFLIDGQQFLSESIFKASGHISHFFDNLIECKNCHVRVKMEDDTIPSVCENCGKKEFIEPRLFNLLFSFSASTVNKKKNKLLYLRPETAQNCFLYLLANQHHLRNRLPFGIGQVGKSFRNEITAGNFLFRTLEFTQMELEYFCHKDKATSEFKIWENTIWNYLTQDLNISPKQLTKIVPPKNEIAYYSQNTIDFCFNFPFGNHELCGLANRGSFDIQNHIKHTGKKLNLFDSKGEIVNINDLCCIEPSFGVERLLFSFLWSHFHCDEKINRFYFDFPIHFVYYHVAICPLVSRLDSIANDIYDELKTTFSVALETKGSIGKRYRRHDSIGTKYIITVDEKVNPNKTITIREIATMKQIYVKLSDIKDVLSNLIQEKKTFNSYLLTFAK